MDAAVEEVRLETGVEGSRRLPAEVRVAERLEGLAIHRGIAEEVGETAGLAHAHAGQGAVGREGLVAVLAPGDLELEIIQPAVGGGHEGLVGDGPGGAHGREVAPLVLASEHGGTVTTEGGVEMVPVVEGVDHTGEIAHVRMQGIGRRGDVVHTGVREAIDAEGSVSKAGEVLAGLAVAFAALGVPRIHQGSAHVVLAELAGVGEDVVDDIGQIRRVGDAAVGLVQVGIECRRGVSGLAVGHVHEVGLVRETVGVAQALVVVAGQAVGQALHPGDVDVQGAAEGGIGGAVDHVAAVVHIPKRVDRVGFLAVHVLAHGHAVGEGRRAPRGDADRRVVRTDAVVLGLGVVEVEAELDVLGDRGVDAAGDGLAHELVPLDEVLVVVEGGAEQVVHVLGGAGDVQGVVLTDAGLADVVNPVRGFAGVIVRLFDRSQEGEVVQGAAVTRVEEFDVAVAVPELRGVVLLDEGDGTLEGDHRLAYLALLGGDHDGAVRSLGAVGGQGGGVLHHAHRLDGVGVDVHQTAFEDHAVQDDQRHAAAGDGLLAADLHARARTGDAGLGDLDAGGHAAEEIHRVRLRRVRDRRVSDLDRRDGSGEVLTLDRTVADDHGFFEHFGVLFQDDVETGLVSHGNRLGNVADGGDFEDGVCGHAQGEVAVDIRHRAGGRAPDDDSYADERFAVGVRHLAGNLTRLG